MRPCLPIWPLGWRGPSKNSRAKNYSTCRRLIDATQAKKKAPADTKAYVPPFLGIKANQIEGWVTHNIPARTRLSVLLRMLVHSTGRGLTKVDFPGNDDAEQPGWDGLIESSEGTPWVPAGQSGWEFGTNENIKQKADDDFEKSVKAHSKKVRDEMTFVCDAARLAGQERVGQAGSSTGWSLERCAGVRCQ